MPTQLEVLTTSLADAVDVGAAAVADFAKQREAFMAKAQRLTGATLDGDSTDIGELAGFDKDRLARGTFQIRGSVVLTRTADLRAQLVAIRNAATSALLVLERGGNPVELRVLVQNHMNAASRTVLSIRRAAGETWAK